MSHQKVAPSMPDDRLGIKASQPAAGLAVATFSSAAASLMDVINRAAADPSTDGEKLEQLLGMYERITARSAKAAYTAALAEMQDELPVIGERGAIRNGNEVQSTYALWEDINEEIRPILRKHGFALSFRTGKEGDLIVVTGVLSHRDGHAEETTMLLPADLSGGKNPLQAIGSSTSYGKRYTAGALLNITSRGEDDDGWAGGAKVITAAQRDALNILADQVGADKNKLCAYYRIDHIAHLPADKYDDALRRLQQKRYGRQPVVAGKSAARRRAAT
jgi:hypothetical protein